MSLREPTTQTVEISDLDDQLAHLIDEVSQEELRVIVARAGRPVAAVVSVADLERWAQLDRERDRHFEVLDRLRAAFADVDPDELEKEIASAVAEVRQEMAAANEAPGHTR